MHDFGSGVAQPAGQIRSLDAVQDAPLHIVLVQPCIPPNTGNVARMCAATGCALHLVEPLGFSIHDRDLKRAGLDYWHELGVVVHPSLEAFLATPLAERAWFLSAHVPRPYSAVQFTRGDVLVFGSESAGLPKDLLAERHERAIRIPMRPHAVRSLNLATSVGIVGYAAMLSMENHGLV